MTKLTGMRVPGLQNLTLMLIALPLFILLNQGRILNVKGASVSRETLTSIASAPPQSRTIEINLLNQHYVPPKRTLKIPPKFKDKGARLVVRVGETLKLCNIDKIRYRPFSYSPENKFESIRSLGPQGILQGQCWTYVVKNPTQDPIAFTLSDDIHASQRLLVVVLPAKYPDEGEEDTPSGERKEAQISLTGAWHAGGINYEYQITPDGEGYKWVVTNQPRLNEKGTVVFIGKSRIKANWENINGKASAEADVIVDAAGNVTRIHWTNGIVFTRKSGP